MTVAQIFQVSRFITNTNSTVASDSNLLRALSERNKQMFIELTKLKEGYGETTSTSSLVNGTASYALPTGTLRLKRAEVQYATGGTWRKINLFDINESDRALDSSTIAGDYSKESPFGDIMGNNIVLYPIPDAAVTDGLKFWYIAVPSDFSATSETPTTPAEYHRYLSDLLAVDIRMMKNEITPAQALQEEAIIWKFFKEQVSPRTSQEVHMKPRFTNYD